MQPTKIKIEKNLFNVAKANIPTGSRFFKPRPDCIDFYIEKPPKANGGIGVIPEGATEIEIHYKRNPRTDTIDGYGEPTFK